MGGGITYSLIHYAAGRYKYQASFDYSVTFSFLLGRTIEVFNKEKKLIKLTYLK
jgi:hypothetical protein